MEVSIYLIQPYQTLDTDLAFLKSLLQQSHGAWSIHKGLKTHGIRKVTWTSHNQGAKEPNRIWCRNPSIRVSKLLDPIRS